jgi:hypothetical protein
MWCRGRSVLGREKLGVKEIVEEYLVVDYVGDFTQAFLCWLGVVL